MNYHGLNALTVKNKYPLSLIRETLDRLCKAVYFIKLDVVAAFNKICMAKGKEWKTAFRTCLGLYEYLVMPFEHSNAPSFFQNLLNNVLGNDILDIFVTAYVDDILVFSKTFQKHKKHVKTVLGQIKTAGLQLDINKCKFEVQKTKCLGLIIQATTLEGRPGCVKMDPAKIHAIDSWESLKSTNHVQSFLGFANFYRRFIKDFAKLNSLLTAFTKKSQLFQWTATEESAFQAIKKAFSTAPILQHFDPNKECTMETDASNYVSVAVLSQPNHEGTLRPVAFMSCQHLPAECNYKIYNKKLVAIVRAFKEWRPELEGSPKPISVISDHKNLEYFIFLNGYPDARLGGISSCHILTSRSATCQDLNVRQML